MYELDTTFELLYICTIEMCGIRNDSPSKLNGYSSTAADKTELANNTLRIMNFFHWQLTCLLCVTHQTLSHSLRRRFSPKVLIGASTSALQIEGAWNVDGKGPSIYDTFSHEHPEKSADGTNTGTVADSYYFYEEDVEIAKALGVSVTDYYWLASEIE